MKEFVARVGGILQAIQAREALPESTKCAECNRSVAYWRCEDCIGGRLLCRVCIRHSHLSNPFHRIECWSGTHFRKAALWEVGVYLILPHQNGGICPNHSWQQQMLKHLETRKDDAIPKEPRGVDCEENADPEPDPKGEASQDETEMQYLEQLFSGHNPDDIMENDTDDLVDTEADVQDTDVGTNGFTNYMNEEVRSDLQVDSGHNIPKPPNCDALNNHYV